MNPILAALFEILIKCLETVLFFYFLLRQLPMRKSRKKWLPIVYVLEVVLVSIMNALSLTGTQTMILSLVMDITMVFFLTEGKRIQQIIIAPLFMIIIIISGNLTYAVADLFTDYRLEQLFQHSWIRYQLCMIYLLFLAVFVLMITYRKQNLLLFPKWIPLNFLIFVVMGIIISNLGLRIMLSLEDAGAAGVVPSSSIIFLLLMLFPLPLIYIIYIGVLYNKNTALTEENHRKTLEQKQYEFLQTSVSTIRNWKHDYHNHLLVLQNLLDTEQYEESKSYIHQLVGNCINTEWNITTGNHTLDAIVGMKIVQMKEQKISFRHTIYLPDFLPINDIQLTSLVGNLLDNAIEACSRIIDPTLRTVTFTIKPEREFCVIYVENSSPGIYQYDTKHHLLTSKCGDNHGIGLKQVAKIISDANGFYEITPEKNRFSIIIALPLT